jgi:peptide/nickel transport system substrate-binding protein
MPELSGVGRNARCAALTLVRRRSQLIVRLLLTVGLCGLLLSCASKPPANTLVMIIESSPTNLDPRVGIDGFSERIDSLIFDDLLDRDENLNVVPGLAQSWEIRDARTYVFHLHSGVRFHNGQPLTSRDVKWTFDSLLKGKVLSTKSAVYRFVENVEARDDYTVVFHLKEPFSTLLWNLSDGAMGIVPYGSLAEISDYPIGSGPFRFVRAEPDKEVILERNDDYWGSKAHLESVRFAVVPDTITRALELRKGSADIAVNALTPDMVATLAREPNLSILRAPGTVLQYMNFNLRDPILRDVRVRRAIAYAIDRQPMLQHLWRGFAQPANSILPVQSWAYDDKGARYVHDPQRAREILDAAGYPAHNGVRFHLTMKTSNADETSRLIVAVLQQQLRDVQIQLDIRTFEFATFFSDITKGAFQVHSLRWLGSNEDPDIFEYVFHSSKFPPNGANRTYYSNPRIDTLIDKGRSELDQATRKKFYAQIQEILAEDLPSINLWYLDNVLVHTKRVKNLSLNPAGNYDFLKTAELSSD